MRQSLLSPRVVAAARACGWLAVLFALAWYLILMAGRMGVCAGGSDSSGYANNAKLILEGRLFAEQRQLEGAPSQLPLDTYVPLGFKSAGRGRMVPTYPLGLSVLFVVASIGTSLSTGMTVAMMLMMCGSLVVTYALGRQMGLGRGWGLLGAGVLAACPLFQGMSLQAMSDVPALFWTTLALVLAWGSRERRWRAGLAGVAVAMSVFVRPSNVLVVLPMVWALGLDWRRWLWVLLGGLPGAVVWMLTNQALFGRFVATGYGDVGSLFAWRHVGPTLRNYAETLPQLLPLCVVFVFAVGRWWRDDERRAAVGMVLTWVLALATFYAFYRHTQEAWWYLRFILPMFPALIVLSLCGLRRVFGWIAGTAPGWRKLVAGVTVALAVGLSLTVQLHASAKWYAMELGRGELDYPKLCAYVEEKVSTNAVIFAMQTSGALFFSSQRIVLRWDQLDRATTRSLMTAAAHAGRPVYAVLFPFEVNDKHCFRRGLAGRWTQVAAVRDKTIWRLEDAAGSM